MIKNLYTYITDNNIFNKKFFNKTENKNTENRKLLINFNVVKIFILMLFKNLY